MLTPLLIIYLFYYNNAESIADVVLNLLHACCYKKSFGPFYFQILKVKRRHFLFLDLSIQSQVYKITTERNCKISVSICSHFSF